MVRFRVHIRTVSRKAEEADNISSGLIVNICNEMIIYGSLYIIVARVSIGLIRLSSRKLSGRHSTKATNITNRLLPPPLRNFNFDHALPKGSYQVQYSDF